MEDELLLAPIGYKHGDKPRLYDWVAKKSLRRLRQEEKRLLYVASSRAIHELHLFAAVERKQDGNLAQPRQGSLLAAGWAGLERRIAEETRPTTASNLLAMPAASLVSAIHERNPGNGLIETLAAAAQPSQSAPSAPVRTGSRMPRWKRGLPPE